MAACCVCSWCLQPTGKTQHGASEGAEPILGLTQSLGFTQRKLCAVRRYGSQAEETIAFTD